MKTGRRGFLQVAAAASVSAAWAHPILGANERVRVGVIGMGSRGQLLMDYFQRAPDAEIAAMLRISRRGFEVWDEPPQFIGPPTGPPRLEVKAEGDTMMPHVRNFLDCLRSRSTPNAPIEAGIACARAGHLGNMALRQRRKVADATCRVTFSLPNYAGRLKPTLSR